MIWKSLYKKVNYFLLLTVSEFIRLILRFIQKDAEVFLKNYRVLTMEPLEAWQHLGLSIGQIFSYLKAKIPDFIPVAVKLAFAFSFIILAGLITLGSLLGINQTSLLDEQADYFGGALAMQTAYSVKEPLLAGDSLAIQLMTTKLLNSDSIIGVSVYSDNYSVVTSYGVKNNLELLRTEGEEYLKTNDVFRMNNTDKDFVTYAVPILHKDLLVGYIAISFNNTTLTTAKSKTITTVILITTITLLIAIFAAFFMSKRITRPINKLMDATRAIQEGNFNFQWGDDRRNDELGVLMTAMNEMSNGLLQKKKVENVFSRYVSPQVANQVLKELNSLNDVELGGKHVQASILFADIVGFTSLSETIEPKKVSDLLNVYFSKISEVVDFCSGHVDKYIGDCAMVVFGVPLKNKDHAFKSVACAWMILRLIEVFNEKRKAAGELTVEFRIGANAGTMLAGNMGSTDRMEYTVVGDSVNLASRLLGVTEPGEMIITEIMMLDYNLKDKIQYKSKEMIQLRGKKLPIRTLKVTDITTPFKGEMLKQIIKIIGSDDV
ncbi:MAG: adenylate/guanylate cyclase domain-containing protein [Methylococcales bacterium]|nr:adenylate/guanylate cyclase domain-containing protein [Methylococcales bacterium]